jgi:hypothetical protein
MISDHAVSRRSFLAATGAAGLAFAAPGSAIPVGLEMYSVRDELAKDLPGTVREVARAGYQVVEFYAPYYKWTTDYAKEVRKMTDNLGIKCNSTHNGGESFTADGLSKAIELNQILGAKYIIWASAGNPKNLDGWKAVAEKLSATSEKLKPLGMATCPPKPHHRRARRRHRPGNHERHAPDPGSGRRGSRDRDHRNRRKGITCAAIPPALTQLLGVPAAHQGFSQSPHHHAAGRRLQEPQRHHAQDAGPVRQRAAVRLLPPVHRHQASRHGRGDRARKRRGSVRRHRIPAHPGSHRASS